MILPQGSPTATDPTANPAIDQGGRPPRDAGDPEIVLSFDVEEHDRIEAAADLTLDPTLRAACRDRVGLPTRWILDLLARHDRKATFFVVGQIAGTDPGLVRDIARSGHEVASHGWDHRRILDLTPAAFRDDLRRSRDALEQVTGAAVLGYRAPTFSIVRRTAWALDILAESGLLYDSSIYPVRHDRYGIPGAPRSPFLARGHERSILELPPATLRVAGLNVPVGGGGYFRLLPPLLLEWAMAQARHHLEPPAVVLYFHPWEFDPDGPRLPLRPSSRFRTYVGVTRSRDRLATLIRRRRPAFTRAIDLARRLGSRPRGLPTFGVAG